MAFVWKCSVAALALMMACGAQADTPAMARGWIVKLKDSKPQPVVRLAAAAVPSDGATSQRNRLWQAAQRQRVGMVSHRPTAFGANVVKASSLLPMAQAEAEAQRLRQDPDVEWVVINAIEPRASTRNVLPVTDPSYGLQTWLSTRTFGRAGVANFPAAWLAVASGVSSAEVSVAVLDSGILSLPELNAQILPGYDFISEVESARDQTGRDPDPTDEGDWLDNDTRATLGSVVIPSDCDNSDSSWHGTAIAAMLVGQTNNGSFGAGMLGPWPDVKVLPVRVGGLCGADRIDLLEGMLWAAGIAFQGSPPPPSVPARVISLSYGGNDACTENTGYPRVIRQLRSAGVMLVASAGNGDMNGVGLAEPTVPANCTGVMAVAALNDRGTKAHYSNLVRTSGGRWGLAVAAGDVNPSRTLVDDGVVTVVNQGLTTAEPGFELKRLAGTSFAAPQVAAVAAMVWSLDPSLSLDGVMSLLVRTARPWSQVNSELAGLNVAQCSSSQLAGCRCTEETCGSGVLDAGAAVAAARDPNSPARALVDNVAQPVSSNSGGGGGVVSWAWGLGLLALWSGAALWARRGVKTGRP